MALPVPILAAAAGVGSYALGRFLSSGGSGPAASPAAAPTDQTAPADQGTSATLSYGLDQGGQAGVLQGIGQGGYDDSGSGGTTDVPYPVPAPAPPAPAPAPAPTAPAPAPTAPAPTSPAWWSPVKWMGTPPASATFAVVFAAGSYWQVDSAGNHLRTFSTGGFSAYGGATKTLSDGRQIGKLITSARAGEWVVLRTAGHVAGGLRVYYK